MPSHPPAPLDPMLHRLWQQASAPAHFVQAAATALARLDRIDAAWQRSAPLRELPLGALLASPLAASQLPLGRASTQALQSLGDLTGPAAQDAQGDVDSAALPARPRRQATSAAPAPTAMPGARQPASPPRSELIAAQRRGPVPPRPAAGPQGPISSAVAAATWAQRVAAAGLGQAMAQVVQRPALLGPLATGLGAALAQATPPARGTASGPALRDAGITAPTTPRGADGRQGGRAGPAGRASAAAARNAGVADTAEPSGFADVGQALLDVMQRLPPPRRHRAPAPRDDPLTGRGLGQALAGAGQAVAGAVQATLAQIPGAGSLAPALAASGLQGLRGLAARAAAQTGQATQAAQAETPASATPATARPAVPATLRPGSQRLAPESDTAASPAPTATSLDDDELTQRLTRVLQREARRDGIDLDDVS